MARRGKDNHHTKSGQLRRRGQYQIQHVMMMINQIKSILYLIKSHYTYSLNYVEACNEFVGPISFSLHPGNTAPFEEMSQRR